MKPVSLLCGVLLLSLAGCKGEPETTAVAPIVVAKPVVAPTPVVAPASPALDVVVGYRAAWNAHNIDQAGSFLADDVTYFDASIGTPLHGREEATSKIIRVFLTAVPNAQWEMRGPPIATNDGVAFEWTFSGTNTGAWSANLPATTQQVRFSGVTFIRVEGGKIRSIGTYYDSSILNRQMGW
ncbi:MAG TPA: nuclear transport factor 2 family protein [Arenimonas sp.]|uniref:ester cyclase n=1 Tax=Arenimonas sp. TaxID=1872635 RepID=UPI002BE23CDC|nr:nuclear transport factor 2 family protein [Arenimonas sp.]HMB56404.1 nuclear transport factor 2 family protein [Arenimonas sp.]